MVPPALEPLPKKLTTVLVTRSSPHEPPYYTLSFSSPEGSNVVDHPPHLTWSSSRFLCNVVCVQESCCSRACGSIPNAHFLFFLFYPPFSACSRILELARLYKNHFEVERVRSARLSRRTVLLSEPAVNGSLLSLLLSFMVSLLKRRARGPLKVILLRYLSLLLTADGVTITHPPSRSHAARVVGSPQPPRAAIVEQNSSAHAAALPL